MFKFLTRQLKFPQKSTEWLNARHNILSSSEVASALECNNYESKLELLKRKCGGIPPQITSTSIEWGEKYEPIARDIFEQIAKTKVAECSLVTHEYIPWLGASPDGVLENGELLEIKCPHHRTIISGYIPKYYWIQMQIQMEVCDVDMVHFFQCNFVNVKLQSDLVGFKYSGVDGDRWWGLNEYTYDKVLRDRSWFDKVYPQLNTFWQQVQFYREKGIGQLVSDSGSVVEYMPIHEPINLPPAPQIPQRGNNLEELALPPPRIQSNRPRPISMQAIRRSARLKRKTIDPINSPHIQPQDTSNTLRNWDHWVSATKTRNYMFNDGLVDWLNEYGRGERVVKRRKIDVNEIDPSIDAKHNSSFFGHLKKQGLKFEQEVIANLYKRFPGQIKTIANIYQARQTDKFNDTITAMKSGTPFINQAVLHNTSNQTYGVADLLVRSDYLSVLFNEPPITKAEASVGCQFSDEWHYRVIDIKFSSLNLRADATHLLNSGSAPAFKSQLYIYNEALGHIQDYTPGQAYILGRKWSYTKKKINYYGNGWFDRAGTIDFTKIDSVFAKKSEEAIQWIRNVRQNGSSWSINPPSKPELYPNMKNSSDSPWHSTKVNLADSLGEITSVWNCGIKNREFAHKKGIKSWRNPECTAANLNIKGKNYSTYC